ncbi:Glycosyltransferase involved in cell wall bisynthesis [Abditibacterium utsteinense]|uniref:Glycosyltransferase involved in cell wall bisynthesis n=1 Tax=Abditibacterium utsteinense TaxID=1960156 RepID=A0A2S8SX64_9BACT|nr:glycosyltransferase family 4 protein [Abditibacterium utsteinense]PQV65385.1 Glycosyltransferase involved in cell wall bisynthesis [Abditibacterium utsteinense]
MAQPSPLWIQVPRPGNHYSPARGSAIATVIYEFARERFEAGLETRVVLDEKASCDYPVGQCQAVNFGPFPRRWKQRCDARLASWGFRRFWMERFYAPVIKAIEPDFDGPVFFHDALDAIEEVKRARPRAQICLWFHNYKWRGRESGELRRILSRVDRIICVSRFVADALQRECSHAKAEWNGKICVVHNGVDVNQFRPPENASQKQPGDPVIITFAGRIIEKKGPHLLLEAAQQLSKTNGGSAPDLQIRIIGSKSNAPGEALSPYEKELRHQAASLGNRVEFLPMLDRKTVAQEIRECDIFCAPALWEEPLGLTILEGMASGAAVVTTRRGGIPEIGLDAVHYFDLDNPHSLAEKLQELIQSPEKRRQSGEKARQRALQLTWQASYSALEIALSGRIT